MNGGSNALWVELSTMADGFANLGRRLLSASRLLHAPGVLPPESLLDELTNLRTGFVTLRDRVTSLAVALGVSVVEPDELNDLKALAVLLEAWKTPRNEEPRGTPGWSKRSRCSMASLNCGTLRTLSSRR